MTDMKTILDGYAKLLPLGGSLSYPEMERRAGEFLTALAMITDWRHMLGEARIRCTSIQTAVYAQEMSKGTAKTVTENKLTAEASDEYTKAREELESVENDLSYLKSYYELMLNGHLFYRQLMKGENQ